MKVLNFGSLNLDFVYSVDHVVIGGETLASDHLSINCGGKGLNQSIALAKAGVNVYHAGKVGSDGDMLVQLLKTNGVNTDFIRLSQLRSGNAIIQVDKCGQNSILLYGGANRDIDPDMISCVLASFSRGDYLLLQNEINHLEAIMEQAYKLGMKIILNPSPADASLHQLPLEYVSLFVLNEIEGHILSGQSAPEDMIKVLCNNFPDSAVLLTLGEKGSCYRDQSGTYLQDIFRTQAVDTTAAGDTFTGYFIAGLIHGLTIPQTLRQASMASSIAVSRMGAAPSIPYRSEVITGLENYDRQG